MGNQTFKKKKKEKKHLEIHKKRRNTDWKRNFRVMNTSL